jgi:hypothetical protein
MCVMCGRVRLSSDYSEIKIKLRFAPDAPAPNYAPDWNKPPTEPMLVAVLAPQYRTRGLIVVSRLANPIAIRDEVSWKSA